MLSACVQCTSQVLVYTAAYGAVTVSVSVCLCDRVCVSVCKSFLLVLQHSPQLRMDRGCHTLSWLGANKKHSQLTGGTWFLLSAGGF